MELAYRIRNGWDIVAKMVRYNLKVIFGNKFIFFLLAAVGFFLLVAVINLFSNSNPSEGTVYFLLIFPGLLLVFYPTAFGIQNDVDARMIEILFGIPNYRYKVWLVRMVLVYLVVAALLFILSALSGFAIVTVPVFEMVFQLMFPIFFLGCLAFMISTIVRNGNGTAVVMCVVGLVFWILAEPLSRSKWNIFLNPFNVPSNMNETIWADITLNNRVYLAAGTAIAILWGLLNLQRREKIIG